MSVIDHLERHLGPIAEGWGDIPPGKSTIQVARFAGQPDLGVSTYTTLGLSKVLLPAPEAGTVTEEMLISVHDQFSPRDIASFLISFAEFIVTKGRAIVRGDVVGPSTPIVPGVIASAVYAAIPALHGQGIAVFEGDAGPVDIIWLIPIPPGEARWVKQHGWQAYESALIESEVDFFDLNRPCVRVAP